MGGLQAGKQITVRLKLRPQNSFELILETFLACRKVFRLQAQK
jgi:hypothetical protein